MAKEVISFQCGEFAAGFGPGTIDPECPDCGPEEPTIPSVDPDPIDGTRPTRPTPPTRPTTPDPDPTTPTETPGCVCRAVGDGDPQTPTTGGGGGPTTGGGGPLPPVSFEDVSDICLVFEQKCFPEGTAPEHSGAFQQAAADAAAN